MGRSKPVNHITSEETWALVNADNKQLMADFLQYMSATNHSERTCHVYESDLKIIFTWIYQHCNNKHFTDLKKRDMVRFNFYLSNDLKQSPARISSIRAVISSLSRYIERVCDEDYPNFRSLSFIIEPGARTPVWEKNIITRDEIELTLNTFTERKEYQNACIVALMFYSGMRISEVIQTLVTDFTDDRLIFNGRLYKTHDLRTKGHGKQGYVIPRYVFSDFKPYYDRWMEERNKLGLTEESLFVTQPNSASHRAMGIDSVRYLISEKMADIIGHNVNPHSLRHCTVTSYLRDGWTQEAMADLLQWKSGTSMIKVYNDAASTENLERFFAQMDEIKNSDDETDDN